jgi:hypothetical protein
MEEDTAIGLPFKRSYSRPSISQNRVRETTTFDPHVLIGSSRYARERKAISNQNGASLTLTLHHLLSKLNLRHPQIKLQA